MKNIIYFFVKTRHYSISILLTIIGIYFLYPKKYLSKDDFTKHFVQMFAAFNTNIKKVEFSYYLNDKKRSLKIEITKNDCNLPSKLLLSFPNEVSVINENIMNKSIDTRVSSIKTAKNDLYIDIDDSTKFSSYTVWVSTNPLRQIEAESRVVFINVGTDANYNNIPQIICNIFTPPFSAVSIDGTIPLKNEFGGLTWNNVENNILSTKLLISTLEDRNRNKKIVILGTVLLSLGISFLASLIYPNFSSVFKSN